METRTEGPAWDALRVEARALAALLEQPTLSLIALGKAYARLADAMLAAARASGQTSMRFEAVVKALELRTPKRALVAFLEAR